MSMKLVLREEWNETVQTCHDPFYIKKFSNFRMDHACSLTLSCLRPTYRFYSVQRQRILLIKGRPLGSEGVNGSPYIPVNNTYCLLVFLQLMEASHSGLSFQSVQGPVALEQGFAHGHATILHQGSGVMTAQSMERIHKHLGVT